MRRARPMVLTTVLLVAVGVATSCVVAATLGEERYQTSVDVVLDPISPRMLYDPEAERWGPGRAREDVDVLVAGDELEMALAEALTFPHELDVRWVAPDRLRFTGRAASAERAAATAASAGAVFGAVRDAEARQRAEAAVDALAADVERLEVEAAFGDEQAAAALPDVRSQALVAAAGLEAVEVGTAYFAAEVEVPCCPVGLSFAEVVLFGGTVGLLAGLVVAAVGAAAEGYPRARLVVLGRAVLGIGSPARPTRSPDGFASLRRRAGRLLVDAKAPFVLLGLLVLGRFVVLAAFGTNLVLDDLTLSFYATQDGWDLVPSGQDLHVTRPGAWVTFNLLFRAFGGHPLALLVVLTVVNLLVAWTLLLVGRRFLSDRTALWVAGIWVLVPNHTSLTAWPGASQIVVGLLFLLVGLLAFVHGRTLLAGLGLAASILCYEIAIPAALLIPLVVATPVVPLRPDRLPDPGLDRWSRVRTLVPVVLAAAWSSAHPIYERDLSAPDLVRIWDAHVGRGLWASATTPWLLFALSAALVAGAAATCLVAWLLGQRARQDGPSMVLAGVLLVGVGLPVAFTLGVDPLGFGDRVLGISSIGVALVLVGIGTWLWPRARNVALVAGAALLLAGAVGQVVALRSWSQAGRDVVALMRYVEALPDPEQTHVWVEPGPLSRNGVIGTSSPTGGANEEYLRRFPAADPDGPNVGVEPTGSVTIADGSGAPPPDGVLVVTWDEVLRGAPAASGGTTPSPG